MVNIKTAVRAARDYLHELYDKPRDDLRLEEVALSDDDAFWYVTLSWREESLLPDREYKQFKISAENGDVRAMTIRAVG
jgi:hypothetical protein